MFVRESIMLGGRKLTLETGRLAKQAHGSILVTYGDTVVLVTAVSTEERPGLKVCSYRLPEGLAEFIDRAAKEAGVSQSVLVNGILEDFQKKQAAA